MTDVLPRSMLLPQDPRRRNLHVGGDEPPIPIEFFQRFSEAVRANHTQVANRVEELVNYGTAAERPDATGAAKFYWETDTDILKFDDGLWEEVGGDGHFLPLSAGSGYPLVGDLYIDKATPSIFLRHNGSANDYTQIIDESATDMALRKVCASGNTHLDLEPLAADGLSNAQVRMFRDTDTGGVSTGLLIFLGNNTSTLQHSFLAKGSSFVCKQAGEFSVLGEGILNVISDDGGGPAYLRLRAREDAERYAEIYNYQGSLSIRQYNTNTDGSAYIKIDPMPDGSGEAGLYLFLDTTTTGPAFLDIKVGDGSSDTQHKLEADTGNVNLCKVAGTLTVGDDTDNVTADRDGVYLKGTATMWEDLRVPASAVKPGSASPTWAVFLNGVYAWHFATNQDNSVHFTVQMPHSWLEGSDIEPHVHWTPTNTDTGDVVWKLEYTWANIDGTFPATTTIAVTDAADGTSHKHQIADFAEIDATGKTMSSMLVCRLYRDVSAPDDYNDDAALLEIDFHYQVNSFGSKEEYVKGP